jgi:hypothetical protein
LPLASILIAVINGIYSEIVLDFYFIAYEAN